MEVVVAGELDPGVVRHRPNHPVLSPIGTAIHILLAEATPIQERAIPTQEGIQDKIHPVIQLVAVLTSILAIPTQEDIQGKIHPIIRLVAVLTSTLEAIQIRTLQVDTPRIQGEGIIQISINLLVAIQTSTQAELVLTKEVILTSTQLLVAVIRTSTQLLVAIQIKGPPISTLEQVATQSEPETQEQGGVSLVGTLEVTLVVILEDTRGVRLVVTPTGIQIIKSSVPDLAEGAICLGWGGLLSHNQYRPWDTSLNLQALPKRPWWQPAWVL